MADNNNLAGDGIWTLGMDGATDQTLVSALECNAPAPKDNLAGPSATSISPVRSSWHR